MSAVPTRSLQEYPIGDNKGPRVPSSYHEIKDNFDQ